MSEKRRGNEDRDSAARLVLSTRERLAALAVDVDLDERLRLTEWERRILRSMLDSLLQSVEDEFRSALVTALDINADDALTAALSSAFVQIGLPIVQASQWRPDHSLLNVLIRRAEEHRLQSAPSSSDLLLELAGGEDEVGARLAMSLLILQNSRLDQFGEPIVARIELPAEVEHDLIWTIGAALRYYLVERHHIASAVADEAIATAAVSLLSKHDEGEGPLAICHRLADRLDQQGLLDDAFVERTLREAGLPLFLAALSVRAGLNSDSTWEILSNPTGSGAALLLKAAGIQRQTAATLLLQRTRGEERIAQQLDQFDAVDETEAFKMLRLWRVDPAYRDAIARLAA